MASPPFFNENENRAYPFTVGSSVLVSNDVIVDCGFITGPKSRFDASLHSIWLSGVKRQGSAWYFYFVSDAPELYNVTLTFTRHEDDSDYATEFVDSGIVGLSSTSLSGSTSENLVECEEPLWSGFLVTGKISALNALLTTDGTVALNSTVEPALIQNLAAAYVVQFALGNDDRTRTTLPTNCDPAPISSPVTHVQSMCVIGDIVFKPGFNAEVRQNLSDNSITLSAVVGGGEGEPCAPVPLYSVELPPSGSSLLEGGPQCNETVRSINGLGGPQLPLLAGTGVSIVSSPDDHKLIVTVDMTGLALCYDLSIRSESC